MRMRVTTALLAMAVWANAQLVAGSGFTVFADHHHELSASPQGLVLHHHDEDSEAVHPHDHDSIEPSLAAADHHASGHDDHALATLDPARSLSSNEHLRHDLGAAYALPIEGASIHPKSTHAPWSWPPPLVRLSRPHRTAILQL